MVKFKRKSSPSTSKTHNKQVCKWGFRAPCSPMEMGQLPYATSACEFPKEIFSDLLRSFNGPEPGGPESTDKKVKERERGWYSLVYAENQKSPCTGLALFMKALGAVSMGWRYRAPSWEGLRSSGRKVNSESLWAPGDQPEKERERESKTQGPKLWWSKGVLFNIV